MGVCQAKRARADCGGGTLGRHQLVNFSVKRFGGGGGREA